MVEPERRTRGDLIAAAVIAAVVALVAALLWWTSDSRATELRSAAAAMPKPEDAAAVPTGLRELWRADSPATLSPVLVGHALITGAGTTMAGRNPATGEVAWSYRRDRPLCGVTHVYHWAIAVYPDTRGCGQVSAIKGADGTRGPTRTSYADKHVTLSTDGSTVLSAGATRLEQWRTDLVRTIAYGEIDARYKPVHVGLGKGCQMLSAAASASLVAVLQDCPDQADIKLTLLKPADDDDEPTVRDVPLPGVSAEAGAQVVAVSSTNTALYLPTPDPKLSIYDETGQETAAVLLNEAPSSPPGPASVSKAGKLVTWWTGPTVVVMSTDTLRYKYSIVASGTDVPLGPATTMADQLLIPLTGGIGVYNPDTGVKERLIPVARPDSVTTVTSAVSGETIIEQRGDTVVGLGA